MTTHTWRCTELHKVHQVHQLSREKGRSPQAATGLSRSHHTTAGLWGALSQLTQSPAEAKKTFLMMRFSSGLPRSLVPAGSTGVRGWQDQAPSHRDRPHFPMGQEISATSTLPWHAKKGVLCLTSVTNRHFHTQNVGSWSCLQTSLAKDLAALSL